MPNSFFAFPINNKSVKALNKPGLVSCSFAHTPAVEITIYKSVLDLAYCLNAKQEVIQQQQAKIPSFFKSDDIQLDSDDEDKYSDDEDDKNRPFTCPPSLTALHSMLTKNSMVCILLVHGGNFAGTNLCNTYAYRWLFQSQNR